MIRGFENYTSQMSEEERLYVAPRVLRLLSLAIGRDNAITNNDIVSDINSENRIHYAFMDDGFEKVRTVRTSGPRIRHIIHVLRVSDTIPFLVATSYGYYISNKEEEIKKYIGSIDDRLRSIYQIRRALKRQQRLFNVANVPIQTKLF